MTIQKLIDGEKVHFLLVNVLREISKTQFIVGDKTGLAVLSVPDVCSRNIEIGKGLKIMKPSKVKDQLIASHPKFNPMKTKSLEITVDTIQMDNLEKLHKVTSTVDKGISFNQIENDYGETAVIDTMLVYVTTKSRIIEGKFGNYQICNIIDHEGSTFSINLYNHHVDKLDRNHVYLLQKVKKTTITTDTGIRMATTNFTKIHNATPDQNDVFKDVKIADKKIDGTCIMFTDLNYYRSCKKDLSKIDEDGKCYNCGDLDIEGSKPDFRCSLIIEIKEKSDDIEDEAITSIVVFMRHLGIEVTNEDEEEKIIELLEERIVGKMCEVYYNVIGEGNNVAVKVAIRE